MPITGTVSQDTTSTSAECSAQEGLNTTSVPPTDNIGAGDNVASDGIGTFPEENYLTEQSSQDTTNLVSSTTVDVDQLAEKISGEPDVLTEPVQSTSSLTVTSDSLDGLKDGMASTVEPVMERKSTHKPVNSFANNSFQSAFAAFAGLGEENSQESDVASSEETETKSVSLSSVEPLVSSAIDSGQVTTSGETVMSTTEAQSNGAEHSAVAMEAEQEAMEVDQNVENVSYLPQENMIPVSSSSQEISHEQPEAVGNVTTMDVNSEQAEADEVTQNEVLAQSSDVVTNQVQHVEAADSEAAQVNSQVIDGDNSQPVPDDNTTAIEDYRSVANEQDSMAQVQETSVSDSVDPQQTMSTDSIPTESNASGIDESIQMEPSEGFIDPSQSENPPQPVISTLELLPSDSQPLDAEPTVSESTDSQAVVSGSTEAQPMEASSVEAANHEEVAANASAVTDSVYFIQMTDATGQVVTSIIDPNDISSYTDTVVYKQCMCANGEIETTIVSSGGVPMDQPVEQQQEQPVQEEQQVIYAHDLNGQLTPIDSAQSATDVAPPGKQFVYMQDSSGRIIRTIMDANQTMVPGQQVYYTQSEDGQIITSVMDSNNAAGLSEGALQATPETTMSDVAQQLSSEQLYQQAADDGQQAVTAASSSQVVGSTSGFSIDNSMSGLSMLAELSHLTSGQAPSATQEHRAASSTDSNSRDADMDEFRPVAMVTRRVAGSVDDEVEMVNSNVAGLKVGEQEGSVETQQMESGAQKESQIEKIISEMKCGPMPPSLTVSKDNLFVQWQNLDAMCWMDVVLIMLVYSPTLRPLVNLDPSHPLNSTLLITLLKANRQAQVLLQNLLKKNGTSTPGSIQTGAGNAVADPKTSKLVSKENMDEIGKAINILYAMREKIWEALQPRLRCERGKHNSPVLVLPLLVREKPEIKQMFTMNYRYVFKCEKCGYSQDDTHTKILPSIPAVPADFNMREPSFVRNCFECQAPDQRMLMKFEGLQDFVQMHFVKGLPHSRFDELSFDFNNDHYEVTAVVKYTNNPDHFIAWVRNAPGPAWMECDDLKSVITRYQGLPPNIPPSQVHMVMWERRLTPSHTLIMRDTEDTRLLASLVLTVQQPTSMAQQQQTTEPSTTASPGVSKFSGLAGTTTPGQATSMLSGLMGSTQTFSPYTPSRGGRGSRGARGSRGRGRAALHIPRQRPPAVTTIQMTSPTTFTPGMTGTTRVAGQRGTIRLPLSALASSGINLRGASNASGSSGTRFVLVGGNNASSSSGGTSTSNKVIMVRSQAGMGQMTATQLLQLLQKSGAISQSSGGTRITTISNPEASSASATQTVTSETVTTQAVMEQDTGFSALTSGTASAVEQPATSTAMETEDTAIAAAETQTNQKLMDASDISNTSSNPIILSPGSGSDTTAGTSTTAEQASEQVTQSTSTSTSVGARTITLNQGAQTGNRYISIPNPSGGGNILTQLVMKGGKMVLVPVSKTTQQEQVSTASIASSPTVIKIPVSSQGSVSSPTVSIRIPATQAAATTPSSAIKLTNAGTTPTSTGSASLRYMTVPSSTGGKRTIQLISVPKGSTGTPGQKTIIVGPGGIHQTVSSASSLMTRLVTATTTNAGDSSSSQMLMSSIQDGGVPSATETSAINTAQTVGLPETSECGAQTPIVGQDLLSSGPTMSPEPQATPTSSISLLRTSGQTGGPQVILTSSGAASSALLSGATSLLASSPQKTQEGFRYILPGSSLSQSILHSSSGVTDTSGQLGAKSFTALSSSGTIIGGQLTPAPAPPSAAVEPSLLSQSDGGMIIDSSGEQAISFLTSPSSVTTKLSSQEAASGTRGRGRGRGARTRGRGGRTPRGGRGGRVQQQGWTELGGQLSFATTVASSAPGLSDAQQIGAHMIESESVDGVPVVSIPEFATDTSGQSSEVVSAAATLAAETASMDQTSSSTSTVQTVLDAVDNQAGGMELPRVITQTIPAIKANHGFDILTQGILGASNSGPQTKITLGTPKTGRSLLTGAITNIQTIDSSPSLVKHSVAISELSPLATVASKTRETLSLGQSVTQDEIQTLIQAAEAAAKPKRENISTLPMKSLPSVKGSMPPSQDETGESNAMDQSEMSTVEDVNKPDHRESRIVSVDETSVSAAERYRMPTELFQPDEESPEKPVRPTEEAVSKPGDDLPSALFQEADTVTSPITGKAEDDQSEQTGTSDQMAEEVDVEDTSMEIDSTLSSPPLPLKAEPAKKKPVGRKPKRGGRRGSGRRKSKSVSASENDEDLGMLSDTNPLSPQTKVTLSEPVTEIAQAVSSPEMTKTMHSVGGFANDLLQEEEKEKKREEQKKKEREREEEEQKKKEKEREEEEQKKKEKEREEEEQKKKEKEREEEEQKKKEKERKEQKKEKKKDVEIEENINKEEEGVSPLKSKTEETVKVEEKVKELPVDDQADSKDVKERVISEKVKKRPSIETMLKNVLSPRKQFVYLPAVVKVKKVRASWADVETGSDDEEKLYPEVPFNYRVLSGKARPGCPRHASLGVKEISFSSPPKPLPPLVPHCERTIETEDKMEAVVKRRNPKLSQSHNSYVCRVKALPARDDAAFVGGSSLKLEESGSEKFVPVVLRHRSLCGRKDWASVISQEEVEEEIDSEDIQIESKQYCAQLYTSLFIQAGDFSSIQYADDEEQLVEEEESKVLPSCTEEKESVEAEVEKPKVTISSPNAARGKVSKRKRSCEGQTASPSRPQKRSRSSQSSEDPSLEESQMSVEDPSMCTSPSPHLNGVDSMNSPSSQDAHMSDSDPSKAHTEQQGSSARRSGRSHIPSKKVLDALEDSPVSRGKGSRKSSVHSSSEDGVKAEEGIKEKKAVLPLS